MWGVFRNGAAVYASEKKTNKTIFSKKFTTESIKIGWTLTKLGLLRLRTPVLR